MQRVVLLLDLGNIPGVRAAEFAAEVEERLAATGAQAEVVRTRTAVGDDRLGYYALTYGATHLVLVQAAEVARVRRPPGLGQNSPGRVIDRLDDVPSWITVLDARGATLSEAAVRVRVGEQDGGAGLLVQSIRRLGFRLGPAD